MMMAMLVGVHKAFFTGSAPLKLDMMYIKQRATVSGSVCTGSAPLKLDMMYIKQRATVSPCDQTGGTQTGPELVGLPCPDD